MILFLLVLPLIGCCLLFVVCWYCVVTCVVARCVLFVVCGCFSFIDCHPLFVVSC